MIGLDTIWRCIDQLKSQVVDTFNAEFNNCVWITLLCVHYTKVNRPWLDWMFCICIHYLNLHKHHKLSVLLTFIWHTKGIGIYLVNIPDNIGQSSSDIVFWSNYASSFLSSFVVIILLSWVCNQKSKEIQTCGFVGVNLCMLCWRPFRYINNSIMIDYFVSSGGSLIYLVWNFAERWTYGRIDALCNIW